MVKRGFGYKRIVATMIISTMIFNSTTVNVHASENQTTVKAVIEADNKAALQNSQKENKTGETVPVIEVKEEDIDAYFANSVFVGDSIMLGFRNYSMKQKESFLNNIKFLAAGSFSASNALWDVTKKSVHPVYKGKKCHIWESIADMGADKVFICLGMNDLNVYGLEGTIENYKKLVANIKEKSPNAEIHIISMTYTLKDAGKGKLKNNIIRDFNVMLQDMAKENGWGYLDMATPLADENGDLLPGYCSDGFIHQSRNAYGVWTTVIRDYAKTYINGTAEFPVINPLSVDEQVKEGTVKEEAVKTELTKNDSSKYKKSEVQ